MTKAEALARGIHPSEILKLEIQGRFPKATDYKESVVIFNEPEWTEPERAKTYEIHDISVGNPEKDAKIR